jgi:hypothetical protein
MDTKQEFLESLAKMQQFAHAKTWQKISYEYMEDLQEMVKLIPIPGTSGPIGAIAIRLFKCVKPAQILPIINDFESLPNTAETSAFLDNWNGIIGKLHAKFLHLKPKLMLEYDQVDFGAIAKAKALSELTDQLGKAAQHSRYRDPKIFEDDLMSIFRVLGWEGYLTDCKKNEKTERKDQTNEKQDEAPTPLSDSKTEVEQETKVEEI